MRNPLALALRNAWFFRAAMIPVLLGVAVGAAVLTGSLMVGDSLRSSLKEKADRQRAGVDATWIGARLIRTEVAKDIPGAIPVLVLQGTVETRDTPAKAGIRVPRVTVWGVPTEGGPTRPAFARERIIQLNTAIAKQLDVKDGDTVRVGVEAFSAVPRGSLLGRRNSDDVAKLLTLTVQVLPADSPANDFSVTPTPGTVLNAFVPLEELQKRLEVPGKCNGLLWKGEDLASANTAFARALTLVDWGVRVTVPAKRKAYISVESETLVLDEATVTAAERAAYGMKLAAIRTLVYLVNEIKTGGKGIPYSLVCATDLTSILPNRTFQPQESPSLPKINDDEILLVKWPGSPFEKALPGDEVTLRYFLPELEAGEKETTTAFKVGAVAPLDGVRDDPNLTPPFPGITDKLEVKDWNPPFTFEKWRISPADEDYWNKYRTTPKAYVNLKTGEKLFGSRFGTVTSLRINFPERLDEYRSELLKQLDAKAAGFQLESTTERLAKASQGGTDFGGLFLGFSFFLIAAALFLVGLLFRLMIERRAKQVGLFASVGFYPSAIRRMFLAEGLLVSALGAVLGLGLAYVFADQLLQVLKRLWPEPEAVAFLKVSVKPVTLGIGLLATVGMSLLAVRFSLRGLMNVPAPLLLRGETRIPVYADKPSKYRIRTWMLIAAVVMAVGMLVGGVKLANPDFRAGSFFMGGGLLLMAGLLALHKYLKHLGQRQVQPSRSLWALALRNAARNPNRSVLTAGLIAAAAFLLVAVESFRRAPEQDFNQPTGGSGGFNMVGEADVPLFQNPTSKAGQDDLERGLEQTYQNRKKPGDQPSAKLAEEDAKYVKGLTIYPLSRHGGDDASCMNLYQAGRPRVLGIPQTLIDRGGFRFSMTQASTPEEKANPWQLLNNVKDDGAIPAFVEQNSAMWMLKKGLGDVVEYPDEAGTMKKFRLVGFLQDCPFQSEILIAEKHFRTLYPRQDGYRVLLIQTEDEAKTKAILEAGYRTHGLTVSSSKDRVATFQAVVGTYLTLFQLLGGFGLLLGVLGLAAVLARAVAERLSELAMLRSIGYAPHHVGILVVGENLFLLLAGLFIGILAAAASVLPHVAIGASIPLARLVVLLGMVLVAGVVAVIVATVFAVRVPLLPALRKE